uniref:Uncharacterized protein n=1 Tax=Glossina pallidipes TaxID=7398 RepID=A0A1A9ZFH1_GLOPL
MSKLLHHNICKLLKRKPNDTRVEIHELILCGKITKKFVLYKYWVLFLLFSVVNAIRLLIEEPSIGLLDKALAKEHNKNDNHHDWYINLIFLIEQCNKKRRKERISVHSNGVEEEEEEIEKNQIEGRNLHWLAFR